MTLAVRIGVGLIALLLGAFLVFNARQDSFSKTSEAVLASAMTRANTIVLTGDAGRLEKALSLLAHKRTSHVFISGLGEGFKPSNLPQIDGLSETDVMCCITLGYEARDTIGNALEAAEWLKTRPMKEAFVVTSAYHMPRALAELSAVMPEASLVTITVPQPHGPMLQLREFTKYSLALIRLFFARLFA
ncbi:MAG: YdcF family protein [Pseudomonadota bacterium]